MTFLWIGLALVALFVVLFGWLAALGLKQRAEDKREAKAEDGSDPVVFPPRRLSSQVPPHLDPHRAWSNVKDTRRDTDPDKSDS